LGNIFTGDVAMATRLTKKEKNALYDDAYDLIERFPIEFHSIASEWIDMAIELAEIAKKLQNDEIDKTRQSD
jgi:hypothetical protein